MVTGGSESGMKPAILVEVVEGGVVDRGEGAGIYGRRLCWWAGELKSLGEGCCLVTSDSVRFLKH